MNRSFLIIFIPALLVAAGYLYLGIRPPLRAEVGVAIFAAAVAALRLRAMLKDRKSPRPEASPPGASAPASPPATKLS